MSDLIISFESIFFPFQKCSAVRGKPLNLGLQKERVFKMTESTNSTSSHLLVKRCWNPLAERCVSNKNSILFYAYMLIINFKALYHKV